MVCACSRCLGCVCVYPSQTLECVGVLDPLVHPFLCVSHSWVVRVCILGSWVLYMSPRLLCVCPQKPEFSVCPSWMYGQGVRVTQVLHVCPRLLCSGCACVSQTLRLCARPQMPGLCVCVHPGCLGCVCMCETQTLRLCVSGCAHVHVPWTLGFNAYVCVSMHV